MTVFGLGIIGAFGDLMIIAVVLCVCWLVIWLRTENKGEIFRLYRRDKDTEAEEAKKRR